MDLGGSVTHRTFQDCHPAVNMLYFFVVLLFGMLFYHPVLLGIAFVCSFSCSVLFCGEKTLRQLVTFLLPTWVLVALINTLFNHYGVTTLFALPGGNRVTLEAICHGLAVGGMAVTVFLWFTCYNAVVTNDKFLHVFGKRLPTAALLVSMTLRFLPLYTRRFHAVQRAQQGIGVRTQGLRGAVHALGILTTWSLENAVETADSMKGRGYGLRGRTHYARYLWTRRDTALTIWFLLSAGLVVFGILRGQTKADYNPMIVFPTRTVFTWILYAVYALLCATPLILEAMPHYYARRCLRGTEGHAWNKSV